MEDNTVQIDLKSIVGMVLDNIVIIVAITLIFSAISLIFTKVCIPRKYTSSVSLYVMNNKTSQNTGEILSSDISASQMLVNTYAVILSDNLVMEDVGKILLQKYGEKGLEGIFPVVNGDEGKYIPAGSIASCVSMGPVNDTEVLQVMATTKDPQVSADVCLAMSEVAPEVLSNIMGVAYVSSTNLKVKSLYPVAVMVMTSPLFRTGISGFAKLSFCAKASVFSSVFFLYEPPEYGP